jgi:hypothetical protein
MTAPCRFQKISRGLGHFVFLRHEAVAVGLACFFLWQITTGSRSRNLGWARLELRLVKIVMQLGSRSLFFPGSNHGPFIVSH